MAKRNAKSGNKASAPGGESIERADKVVLQGSDQASRGPKQLKARQRRTRFIKEYLLDHNATRAATAAGYSEKSAHVTGHRLLNQANVKKELAAAHEKINAKLEVSVERVRDELARLAFYDPRKFFKDDGSLKPISELDEDTAMAIGGLDVVELFAGNGDERAQIGFAKKLKLADRGMNLERLGRYLKMFSDKVELTGKDGEPIQTTVAIKFVAPNAQ